MSPLDREDVLGEARWTLAAWPGTAELLPSSPRNRFLHKVTPRRRHALGYILESVDKGSD